ncbi:hypothetical protein CJF32_00008177 [Rutstroemia sp. NJR-2017a WRK4]|nr:hypothetical protein CJF32_00008177 [Rutstroemia sp. NJR-2017a WRK4]
MAEEQEQQQSNQAAAAFPAPPFFWQHFTPENVERIEKLRAAQSAKQDVTTETSSKLPPRILDLPKELRFLQPPDPPASGRYRSFGSAYTIQDELPSLETQGYDQLYTPPDTPTGTGKHADRALVLKRLAKSLLLNFLELLGIMSLNPEHAEEKIIDLRTLFINFHHLLNEYRPHQARESLILMMQDQLEKSRAETEGIMKMKEKVEGILEGLSEVKLEDKSAIEGQLHDEEPEDDGRDIWNQLEKEFG